MDLGIEARDQTIDLLRIAEDVFFLGDDAGLTGAGFFTEETEKNFLAALAAALIIVVGGTLLTAWHQGGAASPSLRPDQWTGLEWHDITSTSDGLYGSDPWQSGGIFGSGSVVIWSGGLAAVGMEGGVWTSQDGRTWSGDAGAPHISSLAAVGGELVGFASSNVCPAGSSSAPVCTPQSSEWVSRDGVKWQPVVTQFDNDVVLQVVTASGSLVIGATTSPGTAVGGFLGPNSAIYVTSDGLSWHKAEIPGDMADSSVTIGSMRKGFVASGFLPDPQGTVVCMRVDPRSRRSWVSIGPGSGCSPEHSRCASR